MDFEALKTELEGCYVTIPTMFRDEPGLPVDHAAIAGHVRFLLDAGLDRRYATFLAAGAAGDFRP